MWLKSSLKSVLPSLFQTIAVPKSDELVAFAHKHEGKIAARNFFLDGMQRTLINLVDQAHAAMPITLHYAFKHTETIDGNGLKCTKVARQ